MSEEIVKVILILEAALLLHFGLTLLFAKLPSKLIRSAYGHSRRLMGGVFLLLSAGIFGFYLSRFSELGSYFRVAYNLSLYYTVAAIMSLSFATLIGRKPDYRSGRVLYLILSVLAFVSLAFGVCFVDDYSITRAVHISLAAFLFASIAVFVVYFFVRYREAIARGEAYYSEDIEIHIGWMKRSIYSIIGVGALSSIFAFSMVMSPWMRALFLFYFIAACGYIYSSFLNFVKVFVSLSNVECTIDDDDEECEQATEEPEILAPQIETNTIRLSPEMQSLVAERLDMWLAKRRYCQPRINIQSVALELCTNRLYLSTYINSTYNCSFRVWISTRRIEEAKRLLRGDRSKTIAMVATDVGFMSLSSFAHTFKKIEGYTPRQWIDNNVK